LTARSADRLTSADRVAIGVCLVALVAGIVLLVAFHGFVASLIAITLLGVAGIAAVALAFLLVGEGEDRYYEQERDQHRRSRR
jgi:hypothetical protein